MASALLAPGPLIRRLTAETREEGSAHSRTPSCSISNATQSVPQLERIVRPSWRPSLGLHAPNAPLPTAHSPHHRLEQGQQHPATKQTVALSPQPTNRTPMTPNGKAFADLRKPSQRRMKQGYTRHSVQQAAGKPRPIGARELHYCPHHICTNRKVKSNNSTHNTMHAPQHRQSSQKTHLASSKWPATHH